MNTVYVLGGIAFILFPVVLAHWLQHAAWFDRIVWWIREHDFPTPKASWTVQDLRGHAVRELRHLWYTDPRWPSCDERIFLTRLIEHLEQRPLDARLTPDEVGYWLRIRDLRGA